jgi:hypothetical protein
VVPGTGSEAKNDWVSRSDTPRALKGYGPVHSSVPALVAVVRQ